MRNYEIMFIVNPNVVEDEIDKINTQIEGIVTAGGGTVAKVEKMGKRFQEQARAARSTWASMAFSPQQRMG